MAHSRKRQLLPLLEKRLRLFPVVGILGARQIGKSTLLREHLSEIRKIKYVTLDRDEIKQQALQKPTLFIQNLESEDFKTVCIDEVQKAPVLFDTLKAEVDEKRRPGRFALSGSTEFSKKTGIKDSLTGRIALLRMVPLNLREILDLKSSFPLLNIKDVKENDFQKIGLALSHIYQWTKRGGMPGIFSIRDESSRRALFDAWVETTCTRDLAQFGIPRFNPDLARRILVAAAQCEEPNCAEIAKRVGKASRQIVAYLDAFKALFVLYEVEPASGSVGKSIFYIFDAGISNFLGSSEKRCLEIWFLNECLSQFSYSGSSRPDIFYFSSPKGSRIDFIVETKNQAYGVLLGEEETPSPYSLRAVTAFYKRMPSIPVFVLAPCLHKHVLDEKTVILPWIAVV